MRILAIECATEPARSRCSRAATLRRARATNARPRPCRAAGADDRRAARQGPRRRDPGSLGPGQLHRRARRPRRGARAGLAWGARCAAIPRSRWSRRWPGASKLRPRRERVHDRRPRRMVRAEFRRAAACREDARHRLRRAVAAVPPVTALVAGNQAARTGRIAAVGPLRVDVLPDARYADRFPRSADRCAGPDLRPRARRAGCRHDRQETRSTPSMAVMDRRLRSASGARPGTAARSATSLLACTRHCAAARRQWRDRALPSGRAAGFVLVAAGARRGRTAADRRTRPNARPRARRAASGTLIRRCARRGREAMLSGDAREQSGAMRSTALRLRADRHARRAITIAADGTGDRRDNFRCELRLIDTSAIANTCNRLGR